MYVPTLQYYSDCPQLEGCVSALQGQSSPEPNMVIGVCLYTVASKDQLLGNWQMVA